MKLFEIKKLKNGFYKVNLGKFGVCYGCTFEQAKQQIQKVKNYI